MIRTVATTKATAVTTIPTTIGAPEGPTCPFINCASAGLARARPRTAIRTPHHAHFDVMLAPLSKCINCCRQLRQPRERRDPKARVRRAADFADWPQSTTLPTELLCHVLAPGLFADKVPRRDCCPIHPDSMLTPRSSERVWTKRRYSQPT